MLPISLWLPCSMYLTEIHSKHKLVALHQLRAADILLCDINIHTKFIIVNLFTYGLLFILTVLEERQGCKLLLCVTWIKITLYWLCSH